MFLGRLANFLWDEPRRGSNFGSISAKYGHPASYVIFLEATSVLFLASQKIRSLKLVSNFRRWAGRNEGFENAKIRFRWQRCLNSLLRNPSFISPKSVVRYRFVCHTIVANPDQSDRHPHFIFENSAWKILASAVLIFHLLLLRLGLTRLIACFGSRDAGEGH